MSKVVWAWLKERSIDQHAADCLLDVAATTALNCAGCLRLSLPYCRVDTARNEAVHAFLQVADDPNDVLVMLDADHLHPPHIVIGLARHAPEIGVVGALAFKRDDSSSPLFFMLTDGQLRAPADWTPGTLYSCDFVGTGAIAIKRWVFDRLREAGEPLPFFRIGYTDGEATLSLGEDRYFAELCLKHGIRHHCDTSLDIPHIGFKLSTHESWRQWKEANADKVRRAEYRPNVPRGQGVSLPRLATRVKAT
jgi:hypothetical protein